MSSSKKRRDAIHGYTASLLQHSGQIALLLDSMAEHARENPGNPGSPSAVLHEILDDVLEDRLGRFSSSELDLATSVSAAAAGAVAEDVFIVHPEPDGDFSLIQPTVPSGPPEFN